MSSLPQTRRHFLALGAANIAAAVLPGCKRNAPPTPPARSGYIDAHSHVWTPDTQRFPLGPWITPGEMAPASFTAEEFLAIAEPCGVDRAVIIQHAPYYGGDNAYLIDCAKRYPGRFSIVAIVDERRNDLAEQLRFLKASGVRGLRIGPSRYADRTPVKDPDRWLDAPSMQNLWKLATDLDLILCPLINAEHVPTLEPMLAKFANSKVVLDHFSHCVAEKPDELRQLLKLARHRHVHVKASGFYKFGDRKAPYGDLAPTIREVAQAFGSHRVLWGSDCPYQLQSGNNYRDAVSLIENDLDFLDASARMAILRDNTESLFFG
jgi:predicted TIM-barrel fold metal-dependent hydrolase